MILKVTGSNPVVRLLLYLKIKKMDYGIFEGASFGSDEKVRVMLDEMNRKWREGKIEERFAEEDELYLMSYFFIILITKK